MEQGLLDFSPDDTLAGFRLESLEVLNWGTFHQKVWRLDLAGRNGLLTGDIGSGKSTLVDAVTTLLVPANRIAYNKAAGADTRERSLRSYVRGYYKSERSDMGHAARSVALRDQNSYSVILGRFKNRGYLQEVTLAQVFWTKEAKGQPERFYIVADRSLSVMEDFSNFGPDIGTLKKRLKKISGVDVFDSFPKYGAAFRRRFGIENDQALALFHQTVSMKSVGNLTAFVREHMLEPFDLTSRIDDLLHHFDDLNRAHEAVLKARKQIERLTPLVGDCERHRAQRGELKMFRACREALVPYFAWHKKVLYEKRILRLTQEQDRLERRAAAMEIDQRERRARREELKQDIADNGGDQLERLRTEIGRRTGEKDKRREQARRYADLARALDLSPVETAEEFEANIRRTRDLSQTLAVEEADIQNLRTDAEVEFRDLNTVHGELEQELASLSGRKTNIHIRQIRIRERLCAHLGLDEKELPFAGELIQVREDEKEWEGAAERLLHNFGLSLLVPERLYPDVAAWVDATHLKGRLVYYLVRTDKKPGIYDLHPLSLVKKLNLKSESPFYSWLEKELARRFNYACCEDMDLFRKERTAVTRAGQVKSRGNRHEKDDRRDIWDRSHYILGWSNEAKVKTLTARRRDLEKMIQEAADTIAHLKTRHGALGERIKNLARLEEYRAFTDLDWQSVSREIARLEDEKKRLEETSDILKTLGRRLERLEEEIAGAEQDLKDIYNDRAKNEARREQADLGLKNCEREMEPARAMGKELWDEMFDTLETLRSRRLDKHTLTVESCDGRQQDLRLVIQGEIKILDKRIRRLEEKIVRTMTDYRRDFPLETREVDDAVASGPEYAVMLEQLESDNLPRFESRFKALLNENTIREVANFQSQLLRERETIRERIDRINRSLSDIEYNPGRYILLEAEPNSDTEIRDFRDQLKACTEGALTGSEDNHYSEKKFLLVRNLIRRFRGREGFSDIDRRWTRKVTDVRNWFVFAASERWRQDHSEYEHYTDSGGKSGGQKEKLAYTVLAASLAYQFGLEWGAVRSRTFRFVAIDEAFGRGSDESTRYSLELFKKLNLQLLIVTPLQKIHIIEPYVSSVGLVYSRDGQEARLRNMSVEEYRSSAGNEGGE
ncbi:MAG: ATP-dependent exonuclease SbcCD, C subunit-like protein [Desulfobacter sp.]|nr:MAG: ATP-dependent exonuclease SbcCD, C subunit-like protein [Desulfobacter sp.]